MVVFASSAASAEIRETKTGGHQVVIRWPLGTADGQRVRQRRAGFRCPAGVNVLQRLEAVAAELGIQVIRKSWDLSAKQQ